MQARDDPVAGQSCSKRFSLAGLQAEGVIRRCAAGTEYDASLVKPTALDPVLHAVATRVAMVLLCGSIEEIMAPVVMQRVAAFVHKQK
jgi:hypothetical protein